MFNNCSELRYIFEKMETLPDYIVSLLVFLCPILTNNVD